MNSIQLHSVYKYFDNKVILKNLSCIFKQGSINLIRGANGAGKTTLLSILSGNSECDEGEVFYKDLDQSISLKNEVILNTKISSYLNISTCYDFLDVFENLMLSVPYLSYCEAFDRILEILSLFKIKEVSNCYYHSLSQGFKQRVNIAKAFLHNPKWIILDEPTVFLDKDSVNLLIEIVEKYNNSGCSFIISTHDEFFTSNLKSTKTFTLESMGLKEIV